MIPRINPYNFTWQLWRGGSLPDLGIQANRKEWILDKKGILQQYAVGYCPGELLACRPKTDCYAVMFQKEDLEFWTHLTKEEFELTFMDDKNKKRAVSHP